MRTRHNRNLIYRRMIWSKGTYKSMTCFVYGSKAHLLFVILAALLFKTNAYLIDSIIKIFHRNFLAAVADCE